MGNSKFMRLVTALNSLSDRRLKRSTFFCAGLLFLLIFWYPWETPDYLKTWESRQGDTYILMPDTPSFIAFRAWKNPWQSIRPIGYPLFLYPFLRHDRQPFMRALHEAGRSGFQNWFDDDEPIYTIPRKLGIDRKFEAVALVQRVILALGIALFYLSLSQWFGEIFALVALLAALCLSPPPPPQAIMTEPLACALTWLCGAFLLHAGASARRGLCFALACLCAGVSFLIRPQTLSLTGLCSLLFLYEVFIAGRKHRIAAFFKQALVFSPLLIAYGYIAWLSVTGGHLFLHTMPEVHYLTVYYYADAEDARHMPTERARKFIEWYAQQKEGLVKKIPLSPKASPPKREHTVGATILHSWADGESGIWKHFAKENGIGNLARLGRSIFAKELLAGLQPRHSGELLTARWEHFISAFGYYDDVYRLAPFPRATFALNILALALSLGAIAVCPRYRWPLVIMLGIHIMAVLAASLGNVILQRYVEPTVPLLFLTAFCSCLVLGEKLYARLKGRSGPREQFA